MADLFQTSVKTLKDVAPADFIKAFALHLKNQDKIEIPKWAEYVKTGVRKELAPYNRDFMYVRAASIMRKVYIRPNVGIGALRKIYGAPSNSGTCRQHFCKGSGSVAR